MSRDTGTESTNSKLRLKKIQEDVETHPLEFCSIESISKESPFEKGVILRNRKVLR